MRREESWSKMEHDRESQWGLLRAARPPSPNTCLPVLGKNLEVWEWMAGRQQEGAVRVEGSPWHV